MKRFILFALVAAVAASSGCEIRISDETKKMLSEEFARSIYVDAIGPLVVVGVIGAAAPPSGLGGINGLCMDRAWQTRVATTPDFEHPPSIFETPDPDRPFKMPPFITTKDLFGNDGPAGRPCD